MSLLPGVEKSQAAHLMSRDLDWTADDARALGEQGLSLWCELLRTLRERPVSSSWSTARMSASMPVAR